MENTFKKLEDVGDCPDRYVVLSFLMKEESKQWKPDDLGGIARLMETSRRRLQLAKGGKQTQKIQGDIVKKLDDMITQLEKSTDGDGGSGSEQKGDPKKVAKRGSKPQDDSTIGKDSGSGKVDQQRLKGLAQQWGRLPQKERAKAMQDLTKDMPPKYREVIEEYFKKLARNENNRN